MREEKILKLVSSFIDGELSPAKSAFVMRKLETDPVWRQQYEELSQLKSLLADTALDSKIELSSDFDSRLEEKINREGELKSLHFLSRFFMFFERRMTELSYALVLSSLLFIVYVAVELYLGDKAGESAPSSVTTSQTKDYKENVFTAVINSQGELFVNKNSSTIVIDIYSGEHKGELAKTSQGLFVKVISNIDVYRKIYLDHYKPSKDFKRVNLPVYADSEN